MSDPVAKKGLGQHWLNDPPSLDAMCDAAGVVVGDHVLEIGPGTGELTARLLERGVTVTALEIDTPLLKHLKQRFSKYIADDKLVLKEGDIRTFDLSTMPDRYKIVANIPYYLSANLLRLLGDTSHKPERASLLVQKEVAERVAAEPGDMSFVSVSVQFYYETNLGWVVPAHLFSPPPKVDSQILILHKRPQPLFDVPVNHFFRVVKAGFSARRKTLLNSLSGGLRTDKQVIESACQTAGVSPKMRPQELSLRSWHAIFTALRDEVS